MKKHKKFISPNQRLAAKLNGAKSQGPVTPEGKAASSFNSIRHGLCATVLLTNESEPKLKELYARYAEQFQPATAVEADLVEEIVVAKWNQYRCWALRTAAIDLEMDTSEEDLKKIFLEIDEETRTALAVKALADNSRVLDQLRRDEAHYTRVYNRAMQTLRMLQADRRAAAQPVATTPVTSENEKLQNEPEPAQPASFEALPEHLKQRYHLLEAALRRSDRKRDEHQKEKSQPEPEAA